MNRLIDWRVADQPIGYAAAVATMDARAAAIRDQGARGLVWLLEHPALYTAGTSARDEDLLAPPATLGGLPVHPSGRGGQFTYHGPGQRVAYVMLDLKTRGADLRAYVADLEAWIIAALARLGVMGVRREGRVGIWVARADGSGLDDKIAAIGVRVRRWVTLHGVSVNLAPDLSHYAGIVPCGIREHGVTSLARLGAPVDMATLDAALRDGFIEVFGLEPVACASDD